MARRLSAVVVGAGVGGLAAAGRQAHAGFDVRVLEQTSVASAFFHDERLRAALTFQTILGPEVTA